MGGAVLVTVQVGERLVGQASLTPAEISESARLSGDPNPLHHDEAYARGTRFTGIIVSGPQIISLMLGLIPSYFGQTNRAVLGLEFTFRFIQAVKAGERMEMEWQVTAAEAKPSLGGQIVTLAGKVTNQKQEVVFAATGKVLITAQL